jgi:hypothetical protein
MSDDSMIARMIVGYALTFEVFPAMSCNRDTYLLRGQP